jgi:hypothetical protein
MFYSVCRNSRADDLAINSKIGHDKDWKLKEKKKNFFLTQFGRTPFYAQ